MAECISLAEALEILGPIVAWVSKNRKTGETEYWLDGKKTTALAIKTEAHRVRAERNSKHF